MDEETSPTIAITITGPEGAGKTSIANALAALLRAHGIEPSMTGGTLSRELRPSYPYLLAAAGKRGLAVTISEARS